MREPESENENESESEMDSPSIPNRSRRCVLVASTAAVAALAGCSTSSLPVVGEDDPSLGFDPATLSKSLVANLPSRPSTYPGPIPDGLAAQHRRRARDLLDGVPIEPSFPNEAVAKRIARERERAAQNLREEPDESEPLDRLGHWRYVRGAAATVRGAYDAANGDLDAATIRSRREGIRQDLAEFEAGWSYPGSDVVDAMALNHHLEELDARCRRYLSPRRPFPSEPNAAVFVAGELAGDVERARATLDDLVGLHDVYSDSADASSHRDELAILAQRLDELVSVSREQVDPYLGDDVGPSNFRRDIEGRPAEELFVDAKVQVHWRLDEVRAAHQRNDYASAVVTSGRALVAILALSTVVDAIRDGQYGMPESVDDVEGYRDAAVSALQWTRSLDPRGLATILAVPGWNAIGEARDVFELMSGDARELDERDVVRLVASFALARHLARAVPEVHRRLRAEVSTVVGRKQ